MDTLKKQGCKAYRFTLTAVSFGKDEDAAFLNLLEVLGESPEDALEDTASFEKLDYTYVIRDDSIAEA